MSVAFLNDAIARSRGVRVDEELTSLRYGLPTLPFVPRKGKSGNGLVHDARYISRIFASLNTTDSALRLLEDSDLDILMPLGGRYWIGDKTGKTQVPAMGRSFYTGLTFQF